MPPTGTPEPPSPAEQLGVDVLKAGFRLMASNKKAVVDFINDAVDVPILGEGSEAVAFGKAFDLLKNLGDDKLTALVRRLL